MNSLEAARKILDELGLPRAQRNERSALTLLALLDLQPGKAWSKAASPLVGITAIMDWVRANYGKNYAPNTRETVRRQTMHQFVQAGLVRYNPDKPDRAVNSPHAVYQISEPALSLFQTYGSRQWPKALSSFRSRARSLADQFANERAMTLIPVRIADDKEISLSPGEHSELIRSIIESFAPRFAAGSTLIYVGDTGDKSSYFQEEMLAALGVTVDRHGKMPDVVIHDVDRNWLLLIESVTSHGPVNAKRHEELLQLFGEAKCGKAKCGLVFVTAFPSRSIMARYLADIAWETEVWTADAPSHLIHFNGERYLGPHGAQ